MLGADETIDATQSTGHAAALRARMREPAERQRFGQKHSAIAGVAIHAGEDLGIREGERALLRGCGRVRAPVQPQRRRGREHEIVLIGQWRPPLLGA